MKLAIATFALAALSFTAAGKERQGFLRDGNTEEGAHPYCSCRAANSTCVNSVNNCGTRGYNCGTWPSCICSCGTGEQDVKVGAVDSYSLMVHVTGKGAAALEEEGYDLAIFKSYASKSGGEVANAAWKVLSNSMLIDSKIELVWEQWNKAGFVGSKNEGDLIITQETPLSEKFTGGQMVDFFGSGWHDPVPAKNLDAPYFRVKYSVDENPMHLSLMAPTDHSGDWNPYFYDDKSMGEGAISDGFPTTNLFVKLTRGVQSGSYTASTYLEGEKVEYGNSSSKEICITTTKKKKLTILPGPCADKVDATVDTTVDMKV